jgi:sigma-B regulation protein RsbU (phosphoserine phosphatase)
MQMSMVPRIFPAFPERQEFSILGSLQPAREMGGDFYDFFFIDADRLCFCIGDVSGKGVSAALFMAVTKTLIKSHAPNDPSTASILTHVNGELCLDNENAMFVTLFIGILNTRTGALDYANAGHNPPYLKRRDGSAQKLMPHGPVAGVADGHVYGSGRETPGPGDLLYMYTDGVTEEIDGEGQFFSDKRLERIVCAQTLRSAKAIVDDTVMAVEQFRGKKEAEDDVTVLAIEFMGDAPNRPMAENLHITVQNELLQIALAENMFGEFAAAHGLPEELVNKMGAILDDVLNNVISYAYSDNRDHAIEITATRRDDRVIVTISDDGTPFNLLLHAAPEAGLSLEDRRVGGLGIHLVRHLADDISYRRRTKKNELTLTLMVDPPDDQP